MKQFHAIVITAFLFSSGCSTMMLKEGNGPLLYRQTSLGTTLPSNVDDFLARSDVQKLKPGESKFCDSLFSSLLKTLLFRPIRLTMAGRNQDSYLYIGELHYWNVVLFLKCHAITYTERSQAIQYSEYFKLDPLGFVFSRNHVIRPKVENVKTIWGLPLFKDNHQQIESLLYEYKESWIVLFGMFGMGTINGQKHAQFLWIPFPLEKSVTKANRVAGTDR